MAIRRPDFYRHNNPNLPIVKQSDMEIGVSVAEPNDLLTYPPAKIVKGGSVWVESTGTFWVLKDKGNITSLSGWEEVKTSDLGEDAPTGGSAYIRKNGEWVNIFNTTLPRDIYLSANKPLDPVDIGSTWFNINTGKNYILLSEDLWVEQLTAHTGTVFGESGTINVIVIKSSGQVIIPDNQTLTEAKDSAESGDIIIVYRGHFSEKDLLKDGVD